jgi:2-aminoethylphosphonate transport system substrate-binding protein
MLYQSRAGATQSGRSWPAGPLTFRDRGQDGAVSQKPGRAAPAPGDVGVNGRVGRQVWRPSVVLTALLFGLLGTVSCSSGSASPKPSPTTAAASDYCTGTVAGGQVVLYSAPGLVFWYSDILNNFQLNCGVHVFFQSDTSAALLQRLQDESSGPLADVVVAQPPYITTMADTGLLANLTGLPQAASVPADRCDHLRRWCTVVDNFTSWVYNTALLSHPPTGYDDLAGSSFQGKIATARVDSTVDGIALATLMAHQLGTKPALDTLGRLEANTTAHYVSTDAMSHAVSASDAVVANGDLAEGLNDVSQYPNLEVWFPTVGGARQALAVPFAAGMVRGGHNRENANALLAYMWSVAGQRSVGAAYGVPARLDVRPTDSRSRAVAAALNGVQVVRLDWEQAVAQQPELSAAWLALRRAPDGVPLPPSSSSGPTTSFTLPP